MDLLHHEMLVAALFRGLGIPFDGGGLPLHRLPVHVEELDGIRRHAGNFQIVDIVNGAGVLEQRRHIRCDDGAVPGSAHNEGAVLAHRVEGAGLVGKQHAQRVGTAHMQHHAGDGVQRIPRRDAGVVVVQQLGHHLGVRLGDEGKAPFDEAVFQFLIVFDDAVVHHRDLFIPGIMRMGVEDAGFAVGGPAGVADAAAAGHGAAAVRHLAEDFESALGLDDLDFSFCILHGNAGRIIPAIFQLGKSVQQNGRSLRRPGKAYDATHTNPSRSSDVFYSKSNESFLK